jgi:MFS family permease
VRAGHAAIAPLSSPPFRRYLLGQLPSLTGSWAQVVALSWWVVGLSPKALGWVIALQFLPSLVLGQWFGVVADRHDRRRLLMLAEGGLGLVAAAYALASVAGLLTLPVIYVLATAWGVINALDTPARWHWCRRWSRSRSRPWSTRPSPDARRSSGTRSPPSPPAA